MLTKTPSWPPDFTEVYKERQKRLRVLRSSEEMLHGALAYYATHPHEFIEHWCDTWDPRNAGIRGKLVRMPFVLFPRQRDLVDFILACIRNETSGLIEKSRDMGATWVCVALSAWLWRFWDGASIGWGSRKAMLVDRIGDLDSIFEKIRRLILGWPVEFLPAGFDEDKHMNYMRIVNPRNGASITGEAGDEIGRGGRKLIYFKDESAHYDRAESIEAALSDNTRVQIDISSVSGPGTVFHRKRENGIEWEPGMKVRPGKTNVFVMDWRDHPLKTEAWYKEREEKAKEDALLHIFRREVDRDYRAAVEGVIIPAEWVRAAIDAHDKLDLTGDGEWVGALDVADGGRDKNAFSKRKGVILRGLAEWGERDTAVTTRRMLSLCEDTQPITVQWDCIGVGAGVKAEWNRLLDDGLAPEKVTLVAWNAAGRVRDPEGHVVPDDDRSPVNQDFYMNRKAQGWWELRTRFYKTFRAVTEGIYFDENELISISSKDIPKNLLRQLEKELSQPTVGKSTRMKLMIDKAPNGTRSPNLADSVMMNYSPQIEEDAYDQSGKWM